MVLGRVTNLLKRGGGADLDFLHQKNMMRKDVRKISRGLYIVGTRIEIHDEKGEKI